MELVGELIVCRRWLGYPLSLSIFNILFFIQASSDESGEFRLAKVPLGWAESSMYHFHSNNGFIG